MKTLARLEKRLDALAGAEQVLDFDVRTGVPRPHDPSRVVRGAQSGRAVAVARLAGASARMIPISQSAPTWQLEQIARWHEEQAQRAGSVRHWEIARRLQIEA